MVKPIEDLRHRCNKNVYHVDIKWNLFRLVLHLCFSTLYIVEYRRQWIISIGQTSQKLVVSVTYGHTNDSVLFISTSQESY
jgi:mRNA-degrading endonuclease HigB of HigAB toxin-antitoxin module